MKKIASLFLVSIFSLLFFSPQTFAASHEKSEATEVTAESDKKDDTTAEDAKTDTDKKKKKEGEEEEEPDCD